MRVYPQEERNKLYVARCLLDKKITIGEGAEFLHLKRRRKRLKKGVREQGDAFVIHKNRRRKPVHAYLRIAIGNFIIEII